VTLYRAGCLAVLLICSFSAFGWQTTRKADPFLAGPPFTLQQLEDATGSIFEERLLKAIQNRGVNFAPDEQTSDSLRKAGASDAILQAVQGSKHPPHVKPASEEQKTNALEVDCEPAECEVATDGTSRGVTHDGRLNIQSLPIGPIKVTYTKAGYLTKEVATVVPKGMPLAAQSVTLEPTDETRQLLGKQLFQKMYSALGGKALLQETSNLAATGTAVVFDTKGQRSQWSITARLRPADAYFKMEGVGTSFFVRLNDGNYRASKSFSKVPVASEIENSLRLFSDYQLAKLIQRISQENYRLTADPPSRKQPVALILHADSPADRFQFSLRDNYLPTSVRFDSAVGLGSGLQVLYAEYVATGHVRYPREIVIKAPGPSQHGVEFRFSNLDVNAKFTEKDFR